MKDMPVSYHRILDRLERQEARLLRERSRLPLSAQRAEWKGKIPPALRENLNAAFAKAFSRLFGPGGTRLVEYTYRKAVMKEQYGVWSEELPPEEARKVLRWMEHSQTAAQGVECCVAGVEGTALGLLGIGLPDIPVFLALLLRSLYKTATRYGFIYESPEERVYVLLLLQGALSQGEARLEQSRRADMLGRALDHGWPTDCHLEEEIRKTSDLLADRLLLTKFVQGVPVVGAVGGPVNLSITSAVSHYGSIKYKKRFLEKKVRGL